MNKSFILFLLLGCSLTIAQNIRHRGLDFSYKSEKHENRSSLHLTSIDKIALNGKLVISFELCFTRANEYGYLFKVNSSKSSIKLLYTPQLNSDSGSFQLVINEKVSPKRIVIPKAELTRDNWIETKVELNPSKKEIIFSCPPNHTITENVNLESHDKLDMFFGQLRDELLKNDIANFCVRNVKLLNSQNKIINYWKLDEAEGNIARDSYSKLDATVTEPTWLVDKHFIFSKEIKVGVFPFRNKFIMPAITFDEKNNRIVFVSKEFANYFDLISQTSFKEKFKKPIKHNEFYSIYDNKKNKLYSFFQGAGKVSVYNEKTRTWVDIDTTGEHDGEYYASNYFINPLNGDLLMINGYGWYTVKNHLQKYNLDKKNWERIKTKGDFLIPRNGASFGKKNDNGEFFILGGMGSESGKQEEKYRMLDDLYELNMKDTSLTKLAKIAMPKNVFINYPSLHYDPIEKQIFFIAWTEFENKERSYKVFRYDLINKSIEAVSNSVQTYFSFNSPLHYDKVNNEIITFSARTQGTDSVAIYAHTLRYPLLTEKEYKKLHRTNILVNIFSKNKILVVSIVLILFSAGGLYIIRTRKNKKINEWNRPNEAVNQKDLGNKILLFGSFTVIDRNGKDISREFSPKLKQLFLLLIMYSNNGKGRGISTEALTSILWPEMNSENAKNNRNVSTKKLRNILSGLDSVDIKNDKNIWEIEFSNKVYCDFVEFREAIREENINGTRLDKLKQIVSRGELLHELSYEWFDGQRVKIIEDALSHLKKTSMNNSLSNDEKLSIAECMNYLDNLYEEGLMIKIRVYVEQGNHHMARASYNSFVKEYFKLYAEEYPNSFDSFLK